jgi:hypothetical protein
MSIIMADSPREVLEALEAQAQTQVSPAPVSSTDVLHTPVLLNEKFEDGSIGMYGARCPACKNVDIKFKMKAHREKSSFKILQEYCGSGIDLQCLCCKTKFKFSAHNGTFQFYPKQNHVWVSKEWAIANLSI